MERVNGVTKGANTSSEAADNRPAPTRNPENGMCGLPVEIWTMILEIFVESSLTSYNVIVPKNANSDDPMSVTNVGGASNDYIINWNLLKFPFSLHGWDCQTIAFSRFKDFRFVCRNWSTILDPTWTAFLVPHSIDDIKAGNCTRALFIPSNPDWTNVRLKQFPSNHDLLSSTKSITSIVVGSEAPFLQTNSNFVDFLLRYPEYFQSVRSLTLYVDNNPLPTFWRRLEKGFGRLLLLRIHGWGISGWDGWKGPTSSVRKFPGRRSRTRNMILTMMDLETVDICLGQSPAFHFPSLRHLVITPPMQKSYSHSRIFHHATYSSNVESIYIMDGNTLPGSFFATFWTTFPRLRFLRAQEHILTRLGTPTSHFHSDPHSIEYLWLLNNSKLDFPPNVADIRSRFPQLRYFTFESDILSPSTRADVRVSCEQNGVGYVEIMDIKPTPNLSVPSPREGPVTLALIHIHWTIMLVLSIVGELIGPLTLMARHLPLGHFDPFGALYTVLLAVLVVYVHVSVLSHSISLVLRLSGLGWT